MADQFAASLRAEIAALEGELTGNPTYRKLKALMAALREYEGGESAHHGAPVGRAVAPHAGAPRVVMRAHSPERTRALDFARNYVRERNFPTPTREIFEAMEREGVRLGGKSPMNNLSAVLSNSDEFVSHGRSGWLLAENDPSKDVDVDIGLGSGAEGDDPNGGESDGSRST